MELTELLSRQRLNATQHLSDMLSRRLELAMILLQRSKYIAGLGQMMPKIIALLIDRNWNLD